MIGQAGFTYTDEDMIATQRAGLTAVRWRDLLIVYLGLAVLPSALLAGLDAAYRTRGAPADPVFVVVAPAAIIVVIFGLLFFVTARTGGRCCAATGCGSRGTGTRSAGSTRGPGMRTNCTCAASAGAPISPGPPWEHAGRERCSCFYPPGSGPSRCGGPGIGVRDQFMELLGHLETTLFAGAFNRPMGLLGLNFIEGRTEL
jgi:hypothetical protein